MSDAPAADMATDSRRPWSRSTNAGNVGLPDDKAIRLAASEVINAVLPALAKPVMPIRFVLRSRSMSAARSGNTLRATVT